MFPRYHLISRSTCGKLPNPLRSIPFVDVAAAYLVMGNIHVPPLSRVADALISFCGLVEYVETGTFLGDSLDWASSRFRQVTTVEFREDFLRQARERTAHLSNIRYVLGDSGVALGHIVPDLSGPTLFWLDAHAGAGFFGDMDVCPLLSELKAVMSSPLGHCLIIDDARAFLAPPPPPFDYTKWPTLEQVMAMLLLKPNVHVLVLEDAIIAVPAGVRPLLAKLCAEIRPAI